MVDVGEENSFDICEVCGRENENWGKEDNEYGGANVFTVKDHKELLKLYADRSSNFKDFNKIDMLAHFVEEEYGVDENYDSEEEYRIVVKECKRLLSKANLVITKDIERRVQESPTSQYAIHWLYLKSLKIKL
jgi:hypothetical protein